MTGVASAAALKGLFKGRLDMERVAVAGHSYGGATAALVAASDLAFKAGICLDPWWVHTIKFLCVLQSKQSTSSVHRTCARKPTSST